MKKMLLTVFMFCCFMAFACFDSDPDSYVGQETVTITGENGSIVSIQTGANMVLHPISWKDQQPAAVTIPTGFPYTLNVNFSGFINQKGEKYNTVTYMAVYYYDQKNGWTLLKEIANPKFTVVDESGKLRALFGRHTLPSSLGYSKGQHIPVVIYFKGGDYSSFSLDVFLRLRRKISAASIAGAQVLAYQVEDNIIPY